MTTASAPASTPRRGGDAAAPTSIKETTKAVPLSPRAAEADEASTAASADALLLEPLSSPGDFDAGAYAGRVLAEAASSDEARAHAASLRAAAARLDARASALVRSSRSSLVAHLRALTLAEAGVRDVAAPAAALRAGLARARAAVAGPASSMRSRASALGAAQSAAAALRAALARERAAGRLAAALAEPAPPPVPALARLVSDAEASDAAATAAGAGPPPPGASLSAEDLATAGAAARAAARAALRSALAAEGGDGGAAALVAAGGGGRLADVGAAAGALHALGDLDDAVAEAIKTAAAAVAAPLAGLSVRQPGGGPGGAASTTTAAAEPAWAAAEAALSALAAGAARADLLGRALATAREPAGLHTLASRLSLHGGGGCPERGASVLDAYWSAACAALARSLPSSGPSPLVLGYPRLAAGLDGALAALAAAGAGGAAAAAAALPGGGGSGGSGASAPPPAPLAPRHAAAAAAALAPTRAAWAAGAAGRAAAAATAALGGGGGGGGSNNAAALARAPPPPSAAVQRLVARLHDVLTECAVNAGTPPGPACAALPGLAGAAAGVGVATAAERLAAMAGRPPPRSAPPSDKAAWAGRAGALASAGAELHRSLAALLPRCPPGAAAALAGPLEGLAGVVARTAAPAFAAAADGAADAIARLHAGSPYAGTAAAEAAGQPSAWVRDLSDGLAGFRAHFLSRLSPPLPGAAVGVGGGGPPPPTPPSSSVLDALLARLAARVCSLAVRHACLARPLAWPAGAAQLARDLAEVEAALVEECGVAPRAAAQRGPARPSSADPVAALRALRRLALVPTDQLASPSSKALLAALPRADAAHFLLGRGPAAVESPASAAGQPPPAYAAWLDGAPPGAAVAAVRAAVKAAGTAAQLEPSAAVVLPLVEEVCGGGEGA